MRANAQLLFLLGVQSGLSSGQQQPLAHNYYLDQHLNELYQQRYQFDNDPTIPSYRTDLLSLHRYLIDIPSISGSEHDVAILLRDLLLSKNYTVTLQPIPSPSTSHHNDTDDARTRYNVLAWSGSPHSQTIDTPAFLKNRVLLTSHIDVVPPFLPYTLNRTTIPPYKPIPYPILSRSTLIGGRGSVDAKASVAAQVVALTDLLRKGEINPEHVALLFVVGEETDGIGMKTFSRWLGDHDVQLKAAIFGEPTTNLLACGHKGILLATLRAKGRAGHSGYPGLSGAKSATASLIRGLAALLDAEATLGSSERFGNTTVNVGTLDGGVAANVIAQEAEAQVAVRIAVGRKETGLGIVAKKMEEVVGKVDKEGLRLEGVMGYGPVECECDVDGFDTMVASYGTDVPNLDGDHVSYLYGPGSILVAHGEDEALTVGELEDSVEGFKRLVKHALGN
ncbi:hypothetical protein VTJ04DRAFT_10548 [Mycothermus thermophilus]|uniref:uncharacterized protein n=1 Tax=Humicola insolens TaxID=85995 RepID=UPI0037440E4C